MSRSGYHVEHYRRNRDRKLAYLKEWRAKRKALGLGKAVTHRRKRYGLTAAHYDAMVAVQGGRCAICQQVPRETLRVDHDHETGFVRALLCRKCNSGLGMFGDNVTLLTKALMYLRGHEMMGRERAE